MQAFCCAEKLAIPGGVDQAHARCLFTIFVTERYERLFSIFLALAP